MIFLHFMKILATSDTHGNLNGLSLDNVDIALFAGDIAPLKGRGSWHIYDQLKWINTKFKNWCESWPDVEIVFIPGNHDFFSIAKECFSDVLRGHSLSIDLAKNAHMLLDASIEVKGLKIYGTPWVPVISHSWAFEAENDELKKKFDMIPSGLDILITHAPPRFNCIDVSLEYGVDSDKFGSAALAEAIFSKQPKMCFCGHIHSGDHNMNIIGNTHVWNVSRVNESYDIAYEPVMIEE